MIGSIGATHQRKLLLIVFGMMALVLGGMGCGGFDGTVPRSSPRATARAMGVCPPFQLRDEAGNVIDPVKGIHDTVPYSPRQTCGAAGCHDYDKITRGFHFTQGKGEQVPAAMAERYGWVSAPGNYGGNWCSPAPLYRQLAPKKNASSRTIDMTSFDFVTATCGTCHPGGGPMEYDRDGKRYDVWMRDPASGLTAGGENGLDGDYYKARWSETGVIEADCLLCHMPEYDFKKRGAELANLNFRWAATVGAGLGAVTGKVSANEQPTVAYDKSRFDADGNVLVHIAPEPRNETCLNCHFKPDWKKRGAAYSARTDVHMMAGLRCVDCHAAGSKAADPRIREREEHQFGKGDDPSGWVRNDLDNTVRSCESCHLEGWRNAPVASHAWLPPLHLERISCQACHIPVRAVKSALVQASDVYNAAPRITPPPKHIWTFYDQGMDFWNHYGELELLTGKDEPTNVSRPTLVDYKGKIYPANRVHSSWVGFEEQGKPGLNQLFMKDFFAMWTQHRTAPADKFPELDQIKDDNGDGVLEVNRPEEIDALLASVRAYLIQTRYPLDGKRLVWVSDDRACYSAAECRALPHEQHEATAYASVYKFSHDVAPARAALGAHGCVECHSSRSGFLFGAVLDTPFGPDGRPVWIPNYRVLGMSKAWVALGVVREEYLKPLLYGLLGLVGLLGSALVVRQVAERWFGMAATWSRRLGWLLAGVGGVAGVLALRSSALVDYMTVRRFNLDASHFWVALASFALMLGAVRLSRGWSARPKATLAVSRTAAVLAVLAALFGALMLVRVSALGPVTRLSYTAFDLTLVAMMALTAAIVAWTVVTENIGAVGRAPDQHAPRDGADASDSVAR